MELLKKNPRITKEVLREKSKAGGTMLPDFRKYYKVIVVQNRHMDQWNKAESPIRDPHTYGQLIFNRDKNIRWRKDILFSKWYWESWMATCKSMKLEHILIPYMKINSKWLKGLNIKHDTIKLLEKNIGKTCSDVIIGSVFLDHSLKTIEIKEKRKTWELIKHKFCTA